MNLPAPFNVLVHPLGIAGAFAAAIVLLILAVVYMQVALFVWAAIFLATAVIGLISGAAAVPTGSPRGPRIGGRFTQAPDWAVYAVGALFVVGIIVTIIWPPFM